MHLAKKCATEKKISQIYKAYFFSFFGHAASYIKRGHFAAKALERRAEAEKSCLD